METGCNGRAFEVGRWSVDIDGRGDLLRDEMFG